MAVPGSKSSVDPTVLRPGISTSITGLRQAMLALESATLEVKRYMLDEASIIYECKTCNNMFRSLGNLIAHKRTFCNSRYSQIKHIYTDKVGKDFASSQTVFIENEKVETVVPEEPFDLQAYSPSLNLLKEAEILRELKVEPARSRLLPPRKEGLQRIVDRLAARIEPSERNDILVLEPMVENSSAVFQTLATIETTGMDVKELSRDKSETVVVAPSGLPLTKGSLPTFERACSPCSSDNSKENNEVEKVWRYPCPICKGKRVYYSKIFTVYKHIERHHNKSLDEAKLMRKKIKAGRWMDKKGTSKKGEWTISGKCAEPDTKVWRSGGEMKEYKKSGENEQKKKPETTDGRKVKDLKDSLQLVAKRHRPNISLEFAKTLGLVNENGVGLQKFHKDEEEEEVVSKEPKRSRKERRLARTGGDPWGTEDEDEEVSFNLDRLSPQQGPERKKMRLVDGGPGGAETTCVLCQRTFKTPTFLSQHYASSHFRSNLMEDFAEDLKRKKCSICGGGFESSRLLVHIGATHRVFQRYLPTTDDSVPTTAAADSTDRSPQSTSSL